MQQRVSWHSNVTVFRFLCITNQARPMTKLHLPPRWTLEQNDTLTSCESHSQDSGNCCWKFPLQGQNRCPFLFSFARLIEWMPHLAWARSRALRYVHLVSSVDVMAVPTPCCWSDACGKQTSIFNVVRCRRARDWSVLSSLVRSRYFIRSSLCVYTARCRLLVHYVYHAVYIWITTA